MSIESHEEESSFSELSTGQKLSLKGQLFELGRKLAILDVESQNQSSYKFQPVIRAYNLPNRQDDFISNVSRAEAMRKQKLQMLRDNLEREEMGSLTFSPAVNKTRAVRGPTEPVHERLSKKAIEYRKNQEELKKKSEEFDLTYGRKLFKPELQPSPYVNLPSNVSADEFLYRDARDREERMRQRAKTFAEIEQTQANAKKINSSSESLLRRRADREVRELFDAIDSKGAEILKYEDIRRSVERINSSKPRKRQEDKAYQLSEKVWSALDVENRGTVDFETFARIFTPCGLQSGPRMAWTSHSNNSIDDANDQSGSLREYFREMLTWINEEKKSNKREKYSFQPKITIKSKVLAKSKESKDKEQLKELLGHDPDPDVNDESNPAAITEQMTSTDLMFARHLLSKQKLTIVSKQIMTERMENCTFRPSINRDRQSIKAVKFAPMTEAKKPLFEFGLLENDSTSQLEEQSANDTNQSDTSATADKSNVHERLYALKDRPRNISQMSESLMNELKDCTFKPNIVHRKRKTIVTVPLAKDFEKAVNRIKQARDQRIKQKELGMTGEDINEAYQRSRLLAARGVEPFHFLTNDRQKQRDDLKKKSIYRLYIDVKLGPARVGHIKIRDRDDPAALAGSFCRIYGLDDLACSILESATRESMLTHGIEIRESGGAREDLIDSIDQDIVSLQTFESDSGGSYNSMSDEDYSDEDRETTM